MPFVTVVTLGASAATDFISSVVKPQTEEKSQLTQLTGIREIGENELYDNYPFVNCNKSGQSHGNEELLENSRKKSVSFVDLSSVNGKLSFGLPSSVTESGYAGSSSSGSSSISSASSSSSNSGTGAGSVVGNFSCTSNNNGTFSGTFNQIRSEDELLVSNGEVNHTSCLNITNSDTNGLHNNNNQLIVNAASVHPNKLIGGGTIQGKANIWKTWIRNKLNLTKNGKYSFEGSTACLGHFGIKANKSLLVDCTPETEYSKKKYYALRRATKESNDVIDDLEDNCNLFVRECLKTYSTPFLELTDDVEEEFSYNEKPKHFKTESLYNGTGNKHNNNSSYNNVPAICQNLTNSLDSTSNSNNVRVKAPPFWFWNVWCQSRFIQLDEAGIALEGRVGVIYKDESFGDRYVQIKWDDLDEKFTFIVWTVDAGRDFVCKIDLGSADPVWHGEHKLTIDETLIVYSDQKRSFLRDLYTVCVELGCYEKSACLASLENVDRVRHVLELFQRAATLGVIKNGRSWTKVRIKTDLPMENGITKSKHKQGKSKFEPSPTFFTVRLDSVEFRLKTDNAAPVEPYFLSLSLFDVKNGRKISEDFHTTLDANGKLDGNQKAVFKVSEANEQIFAVLKIEKTLQATDVEAYLRGNPDPKTGTRISKQLLSSPLFTEEQKYRMPLCWTSRCLFKKSGSVAAEGTGYVLDTESTFTPFYKYEKYTEEELLKTLADIRKPEKVAKLTIIPGGVKIHVESMKPDELAVAETKENCSSSFIIEFPINSCDNFSRFVHFLYVYPLCLNLNAVSGKIRARNILCRVFLRAEDDIEASPLDQSPVSGSISTYVLHHRSNPDWYSEIKLSLPVALDPRLHLLFQFFHISCSFEKATKSKQVENIIGYAWTPLLNKFRFIGGEHTLPVAASLPSGYLQIQPLGLGKGNLNDAEVPTERSSIIHGSLPQLLHISRNRKRHVMTQYSGPEIAWLDSKCSLTVKLNLISTVWTKCGSLGAFFAHSEKYLQKMHTSGKFHCDDETTIKMLRSLETMDLSTLRDFFPTIINQICQIAGTSKSVGTAAFKFLIFAFHTLIEADLESVIEQYVRYRFLSGWEEEAAKNKVKEEIMSDTLLDAWIDLFETGDGATIASSLEHSRNLFSMIVKSVAVQGVKSPNNPEDSKLVKLIQLFTSEVVQRCQSDHGLSRGANENEISFISALLSVVPQRHVVFAAINSYLACFGPGDAHKVQDFKFSLLQSLVEHPLFLELNSADVDDEFSRLESVVWCKKHFLVATVMKQCRSGLGEVSNVRSLALKPIMLGLVRHEASGSEHPMWIPWLRVVCDNLHRITKIAASHSSRCSSVSTVLSATTSTLVHQALSKSISGQGHEGHNHGQNCQHQFSREGSQISNNDKIHRHTLLGTESSRCSSLSLNVPNGLSPSISQNSSMVSINNIGKNCSGDGGSGERLSLDRMSFGSVTNCDYLDAISAIKTSNPAASAVPSTNGSETETIVNEDTSNGSAETHSMIKEPSDEGEADSQSMKRLNATSDVDKSNVVLRRYDKLADVETSQLLISGLYLLKKMGNSRLRLFWNRSSSQERASLLQMIHLACVHFTNARKNSTITKTKVVGITVPPTMPPSPRSSAVPNKKWSSLPSKTDDAVDGATIETLKKGSSTSPFDSTNEWKTLSTETTFVCVDTLSNLCGACEGEAKLAELREVIRTTLDVAKAAEDTRAMLGALQNLYQVEELASIVFAKGNEDLTHHLFCELLNGFGMSYLINICVLILGKLFMYDTSRTTSQSLLAISSLSLDQVFVHNFRKALSLLERNMSVNDRSSFLLSITEKLSFIDVADGADVPSKNNSYSKSNTLVVNGSLDGSGKKNRLTKSASTIALNLSSRLATVINSLWILRSCHNDYRIPEMYLKLANSYSHFARGTLRIDAFDSLKDEHLCKKRYSEALVCELHVAARLARQTATPEIRRIMLGISENLRDEFEELDEAQEEVDYTEDLIDRLEKCVHLCEKSERYELMLEVYRMLVDIQESSSDYAALEHSYTQMSRACKLIRNKRERFLGTYYRVALFHPKKHSNSRPMDVFIYKEPNVTSLNEICGKVEAAENAIIISGEVDQLPDDDNLYATITHVSPLPSDSPRRKIWSEDFRRHQNVQKFTYDTPFAVKSHDKISIDNKAAVHQQWKRRTTVTTEYTFPAVVSRLRIVESAEEDLSPIIVAIDDMNRRVIELKSELHSQDIKRIQLRLQGSISVQVNQGPLAYARAFLDKENEYPAQDIQKLKAIYRDFIECCRELLIKNGNLIMPEQTDYQNQLESDYARLCQVLSPYLGLPELLGLNRMSRVSVSSY